MTMYQINHQSSQSSVITIVSNPHERFYQRKKTRKRNTLITLCLASPTPLRLCFQFIEALVVRISLVQKRLKCARILKFFDCLTRGKFLWYGRRFALPMHSTASWFFPIGFCQIVDRRQEVCGPHICYSSRKCSGTISVLEAVARSRSPSLVSQNSRVWSLRGGRDEIYRGSMGGRTWKRDR